MSGERGAGGALTRGEKLGLLLRSFFLQSVWNSRGMQNVGFCFVMSTLVARFGDDRERVRGFLERHLSFFNTNPTLASYVIGAAARAEAAGEPERAIEAKRGLSGPLGMAGDALLWGALRPLAALVAVALAVLGRVWAPVAFLVIYNVPHLFFRARGIAVGAASGPAGAREVMGAGLRTSVAVVRSASAFAAGIVLALAVRGVGGVDPKRAVVAASLFVLAYVAVRLRIPLTLIGAAGAIGAAALLVTAN
jgi:mannose/fructose/N-acetylgalactosamine-specific phosphotransferase system component IID